MPWWRPLSCNLVGRLQHSISPAALPAELAGLANCRAAHGALALVLALALTEPHSRQPSLPVCLPLPACLPSVACLRPSLTHGQVPVLGPHRPRQPSPLWYLDLTVNNPYNEVEWQSSPFHGREHFGSRFRSTRKSRGHEGFGAILRWRKTILGACVRSEFALRKIAKKPSRLLDKLD